jgi:polygalacturonase
MRLKALRPNRLKAGPMLHRAANCEKLEVRRLLSVTAPSNIPTTVFNVTSYGAVGNGLTTTAAINANTTGIQNAIAAAAANKVNGFFGGIVEIPAASAAYVSGPLTLASNVDLQIDSGAELQAEPMASYPNEGSTSSVSPFITGSSLSNYELTGSGTIDGNGSAWWTAFDNNDLIKRPYLISLTNSNIVLVSGLTLQNSPMFHLAFSSTNNVTINGITVNTSNSSPNTDGIDPAGMHYLIENCNISTGDDNIAIKPQDSACGDFTITGCTFGYGHGLSVGGETNDGLNGLTVTNCTFTNTTSGIRLKAERTMGGLVENLSYSNLTMNDVEYPININSYYNIGTIPSTPTDPAEPITSTTPIWENISLTNITVTNPPSDSYAGVIWGLPEEPVMNVTLTNVQTTGHYGFDLDHVRGIHFDGQTTITATGGGAKFISDSSVSTPYDAVYWVDQDVNAPAVAGNAAFDLTSHNFTVNGTGASIGALTTDQFNFNSTNLANSGTLVAQINSQTSSNAASQAGVMIRNTIATNSAFAAVLLTPGGSVSFLWRTTGGTLGSATVTGQSAGVWVKLVDSTDSFTAFYSSNGMTWTQIGSAQSISMGTNTLAGLAVNSGDNSTSNTAVFANVELFSVLTGAFASASPVITASTVLSVFAADVLSESGVIYTWSISSVPSGATAPILSPNDSNPAEFTTATFSKAGAYGFLVTIRTASGLVMTSIATVTVNQTFTAVAVTPANVLMHESTTQQLTASALDQFNNAMASQPSFTWTEVSGGVGSVSTTGLYTATTTAGTATIDATSSSIVGTSAITVSATATNLSPTVATAAAASPSTVTASTANLSVLGADDNGESNLIYTWAATTVPSGAPTPTYSVNGTNAAKNTTVTVGIFGDVQIHGDDQGRQRGDHDERRHRRRQSDGDLDHNLADVGVA